MILTKNLNKAFLLLTYLIGCFPILTFGMRSVTTIVWSILGVFIFFRKQEDYKLTKDIWIFVLPFLILAFSLTYSANLQFGIAILIKMISVIIFPFIFYLNSDFFTKKQISKIIYFFVFSVFIIIIYQFIQVGLNYTFITDNITLQEIKSNGFFALNEISEEKISQIKLRRFRNFIIKISNTHTTYQGLWISFSVFFLASKLKKAKRKLFLLGIVLLIALLSIWFYMISVRIAFLAFIVSIVVYIFIFSEFSKRKKILISVLFSGIFLTLLMFENPFSIRVKEYYKTGFSLLEKKSKATEFNSSNVRNGIYYCDFKLIQESPLFGVGVGDVQDKLNGCFRDNLGSKIYNWHTFNSHNQYMFFWISSGVLGLMSFMFLIFKVFMFSLKEKNKFLFFITLLIAIFFLTENLLERSDGLIFYSFFTGVLYFNSLKE